MEASKAPRDAQQPPSVAAIRLEACELIAQARLMQHQAQRLREKARRDAEVAAAMLANSYAALEKARR